ncbi:hypothetical protein STEG23_007606 [Scotinomys teguina]
MRSGPLPKMSGIPYPGHPRKANQVNCLKKTQEGTMEQRGHQEDGGSSSGPVYDGAENPPHHMSSGYVYCGAENLPHHMDLRIPHITCLLDLSMKKLDPWSHTHRPWNDSEIRIFLLEWEVVGQEVGHPGQKLEKKVKAIRKRLYQQRGLRKSWQDSWQLLCDLLSLHSRLCNDRGQGIKPLFSPYSEDLYRILGHRQESSSTFSGPLYHGARNPLLPMSSGPVYDGAENSPCHMSSGPVYFGAGNPTHPMDS